ncbi:porin family protein [Sphingobacterium sp. Mn56C]|uniref:porin family protein n=1 Tax=Sphingobacterium sp. Mn56C TaxID=3395261 RepID=UPI003BE0CE29
MINSKKASKYALKTVATCACVCAFFSFKAAAQTTFGVKGGLNLAFETSSYDGESATTKPTPTYHLGGYVNNRLGRHFSLQPGLFLQGKGARTEVFGDKDIVDDFLYLEVPVNAVWDIQIRNGGRFFWGAGPFVGYNLHAKVKQYGVSKDLKKDPATSGYIKDVEVGLNFLFGYQLPHGFLLNAGSSFGLSNMAVINGAKFKNTTLSLGIGWAFN